MEHPSISRAVTQTAARRGRRPSAATRRDQILNEYHILDARQLTDLLGPDQVDVTITSPPYWDLKNYGASKQIGYGQSYSAFMTDLEAVFESVWTCTKPTGSLWIVLDSIKKNGHVHLLPFDLINRLTNKPKKAWHLQDVLIWHKPHTLPWSHSAKLQGHFEYILCFSKTGSLKLNLDSIRTTNGLANWWVKYPERYHPLGKSISNVWEYSIPTQGIWGNGHFTHYCPIPIEMAQRIILLATQRASQVVLDPFAGSGSTLIAAHSLGRQWVGIDVNRPFRTMFYRRLAHDAPEQHTPKAAHSFKTTNLKLRQLKYAVQLFRAVAPSERLTTADIPLVLVRGGTTLSKPSPQWVRGCRVILVIDDEMTAKRLERLHVAIEEARSRAPLSKYQLEVDVEICRRSSLSRAVKKYFSGGALHRYTQGHFWRACPAEAGKLIKNRPVRLPDIISDVQVNERPAY